MKIVDRIPPIVRRKRLLSLFETALISYSVTMHVLNSSHDQLMQDLVTRCMWLESPNVSLQISESQQTKSNEILEPFQITDLVDVPILNCQPSSRQVFTFHFRVLASACTRTLRSHARLVTMCGQSGSHHTISRFARVGTCKSPHTCMQVPCANRA